MTERETRIDDMNESKTRFISRENPFLPVDRDTTVPVAQCNGLRHVTRTLSRHTVSHLPLQRQNGTSTPCASNTLQESLQEESETPRYTPSPSSPHTLTARVCKPCRPRLHLFTPTAPHTVTARVFIPCRPRLHTFTPSSPHILTAPLVTI